MSKEIMDRIVALVRKHPEGLDIGQIADGIKVNRNTAARYLDCLVLMDEVQRRNIGVSKLHYPVAAKEATL